MNLCNSRFVNICLLMLVAISAVALEGSFLQIALHILLPIVFLVVVFICIRDLLPNPSLKKYMYLLAWLFIASLFAYNRDVALQGMIKIASGFFLSLSIYHLSQVEGNAKWLYLIMISSFASMMYYASTNIGFVIAQEFQDRLGDEVLNANMFAYFLFYSSFAIYFLLRPMFSKMKFLEIAIVLGLFVLSAWISLMTASRQVLYLQIPFLICLFLVGKLRLSFKNIFALLMIVLIVCFVALPFFDTFYSGSLLADRSATSFQEDSRSTILMEAIKCGLSHPLFGVGPSNFVLVNRYHIFSHNCYAELFAGGGFVALVLYVTIIWINLKMQLERYRMTKDNFYMYHFIFQLFFAIDNMLYVQINSLWLMGFYFVSVGHSDFYYKHKIALK